MAMQGVGNFVGRRGYGSFPSATPTGVSNASDAARGLPYIMPSAMHGPGVRYGSGAGERSTTPGGTSRRGRNRSRDRDRDTQSSARPLLPQHYSQRQMGAQETMEWNEVFDNLIDRTSALENLSKQKDIQYKEL